LIVVTTSNAAKQQEEEDDGAEVVELVSPHKLQKGLGLG